jgi:23S rRNA (guanine745-N1)-methyltransferase
LKKKSVSYEITLSDNETIANLFSMTPYYYRTGEKDREKLNRLEYVTTPVDVFVRVYKK